MMRQTSRAARPSNTDAQRESVLALFAREPYQPSRQAVSDKTGIPEKSLTWRIREMLDAGTLKELDAVDGKHPLELIESAPLPRIRGVPDVAQAAVADVVSMPLATVFGKPQVVGGVGSHGEQSPPRDSIRKPFSGPGGTQIAAEQARGDLTALTATNPSGLPAPAASQGVTPTLISRMSLSVEEARRSTSAEAALVRRAGHAIRLWDDGSNWAECARVDAIVTRVEA